MVKTKSATPQQVLTAKGRATEGKRRVRRLRDDGVVPGIVYGKNMKPVTVEVNYRELLKFLHSKAGEQALVTLRVEDTTPWEKPVLVKSVQHDPVNGHLLHVDFHAIVLTERLKVKVPVLLKGEAVGVKQEGGILEHFLREVAVECLPTEIPQGVEFDVSALKIGDTIHVKDLTPPKNVKITSDPEWAVASVLKPKEEKPEEAVAAVTEPEVIREKKEEAEGATPGAEAKSEAPARPSGSEGRAGDAKKESKS